MVDASTRETDRLLIIRKYQMIRLPWRLSTSANGVRMKKALFAVRLVTFVIFLILYRNRKPHPWLARREKKTTILVQPRKRTNSCITPFILVLSFCRFLSRLSLSLSPYICLVQSLSNNTTKKEKRRDEPKPNRKEKKKKLRLPTDCKRDDRKWLVASQDHFQQFSK